MVEIVNCTWLLPAKAKDLYDQHIYIEGRTSATIDDLAILWSQWEFLALTLARKPFYSKNTPNLCHILCITLVILITTSLAYMLVYRWDTMINIEVAILQSPTYSANTYTPSQRKTIYVLYALDSSLIVQIIHLQDKVVGWRKYSTTNKSLAEVSVAIQQMKASPLSTQHTGRVSEFYSSSSLSETSSPLSRRAALTLARCFFLLVAEFLHSKTLSKMDFVARIC